MQKGFSNTSFRKDFDFQISYNQIFILKSRSVSDSNLDGNTGMNQHFSTASMELVSFDSSVQYHPSLLIVAKPFHPTPSWTSNGRFGTREETCKAAI